MDWAYTRRPPRTRQEALARLVPTDAAYTLPMLLDAMRVHPQFGRPDDPDLRPSNYVIAGQHQAWTHTEARSIVTDAFGANGHENLEHAVSYAIRYDRHNKAIDPSTADDDFFTQVAHLLRGGYTQDCDWVWWRRMSPEPELALTAGWAASWDLISFVACVRAGLTLEELQAHLDTGEQPDPTHIAFLAGLDARNAND